MVQLDITHSVLSIKTTKNFFLDMKIGALKDKLYTIVGTAPMYMDLELYSPDDKYLGKLSDEKKTLNDYGVIDDSRIHVVDVDPSKKMAAFSDEALKNVKKYNISEEDYDNRSDTLRKWKNKIILQKKLQKQKQKQLEKKKNENKNNNNNNDNNDNNNDNKDNKNEEDKKNGEEEKKIIEESIKIGDRIEMKNILKTRGTIKFIGTTKFASGWWFGIQLDEPVGKNDGSVKGSRYFECLPKYGIFVQRIKFNVGDYPVIDLFADSDDEI